MQRTYDVMWIWLRIARRPKAGRANSEATSAIAIANSALRGRTGNFGCERGPTGEQMPQYVVLDT